MGYFSHSQNFPTRESVIDLINFTLEMELKCDPGALVDLVIVNSDSGWQQGRDFLDSIDGRKLPHGRIRVLHRKNFGLSFGAYNHAFMTLGEEYDYFIFTEDDVVISRDGYASKGMEFFNKTKNCGFVAYLGLSTRGIDLRMEDAFSAHGGIGLSSTGVLNEVVKRHGSLPHADESLPQTYQNHLQFGEVAFTNRIHKLGYKLVNVPRNIKLYDFAYDLIRGLDVKRYPSLPKKMLLLAKHAAYKHRVVRYLLGFYKVRRGQAESRAGSSEDWAGR